MQSEQTSELFAALAKAQGQIKNPVKNRKVEVVTKSGSKYEFWYADLTAIIDEIKKPLSDNGIGYLQYVQEIDGRNRLITQLTHSSGQWFTAVNPLFVGEQSSQAFGSGLTFMKRYALASILGISADDDDDANAADGNEAKLAPRTSAPAIKPPTKAAEALTEIAASNGNDGPSGDKTSAQAWRRFAEKAIEHARKGGEFTPEQQQKMSLMKQQSPAQWQKMADAIADAQMTRPKKAKEPKEPKEPEAVQAPIASKDPDAYRLWFIDQMSQLETVDEIVMFTDEQKPLWEDCFPPDIEDWEGLAMDRVNELSK